VTYLITFSAYGTRLHGDADGSVDPAHNVANTPTLPANALRQAVEERNMLASKRVLDERERTCARGAIEAACRDKGWTLLASHVRSTHVHVVIDAESEPERLMNGLKTAISRTLNRAFGVCATRRWSRHGSTRYLWNPKQIQDAIRYVTAKQGAPMAVSARGWER